ncbi:hypothetical protein R5H32_01205 [Defluviimonas sp. D31]|uniref:hypothetical protein n=1 Tax=Defluviimonas sp. D31 TaxID=3083253 RepID=UPI00296EF7B4|nr:hypothetical protein [Defluviimonas sp. D31]MDW4547959.1 hypothetical protein [Defluviimonas sp. D31]
MALILARLAGGLRLGVLACAMIGGLAACEPQQQAIGQCEEGVADISRVADIAPVNC